jgi:hypothetical protein
VDEKNYEGTGFFNPGEGEDEEEEDGYDGTGFFD